MTPAAIEAGNLYRFFRAGDEEILALRGVSLAVQPGETVAVVGPSGSGKSTLLSCLAGLDEPDGGMVTVSGEKLSHRPEPARARVRAQRIGVLLQSRNLLLHLDIRANIRLAQRANRAPIRRVHPDDLLEQVGLTERAKALPSELSGGELARAGLAVALANTPTILLADEPTGELDGQTEDQVLGLLRSCAGQGAGLLIVTHSAAVVTIADRVIAIRDGQVAA